MSAGNRPKVLNAAGAAVFAADLKPELSYTDHTPAWMPVHSGRELPEPGWWADGMGVQADNNCRSAIHDDGDCVWSKHGPYGRLCVHGSSEGRG